MLLKQTPQWILAKGKIPRSPLDGGTAGSTHTEKYVDFPTALDAAVRFDMNLGFCFSPENEIGGVDIDNCVENGRLKSWAIPIVAKLRGSFMELSVSGTGIHIYGRFSVDRSLPNTVPVGDGKVEIFTEGRFFVFTGDTPAFLNNYHENTVADLQRGVDWFYSQYADIGAVVEEDKPGQIVSSPPSELSRTVRERLLARVEGWLAKREVNLRDGQGRDNMGFNTAVHLWKFRDELGQPLEQDEVRYYLHLWNSRLTEPCPDRSVEKWLRNGKKYAKQGDLKTPKTTYGEPFSMRGVEGPPEVVEEQEEELTVTFGEVAKEWGRKFELRQPRVTYYTGVPQIEFAPGRMLVIGGGPGAGKSALTMQMVKTALEEHQELSAICCSIELEPPSMLERLVSAETDIPCNEIQDRMGLTEGQEDSIRKANTNFANGAGRRLHVLKYPFTMDRLSTAVEKVNASIVVIDYLQRVNPSQAFEGDTRAAVNHLMNTARFICQMGSCVVLVSSLSRSQDGYKAVNLTSFRESGEIEYGVDDAFGMWRDESDRGLVHLNHLKSRYRALEGDWQMRTSASMKFSPVFLNGLGDGTPGEVDWENFDDPY